MWKTVKLGDVCKIFNGGTPKSNVTDYWGGDVQWLTPKDMGKLDSRYVKNTERKITIEGLNNSSAKLVPSQSVILSCRAPIGHVFINEVEMSFNQGCKGLITTNEITVEYLYYFLFSSKKLLNDLGTGTTFKEISGKTLANVSIPLPPLAEQKRIVAKLDAAFAEIDRAIEAAKKQANAASDYGYRIIETSLEELSEKYGLSSISKVAVIQPKKKLALEKLSEGDDVSFMGMDGLGIEKKYSQPEKNKKLSEVYKSYQYFEDDDVIFAKITPCFENGKLGIVKGLTNGIGFGSSEFVVLRTHADFQSEFLYYCLLNEVFRNDGAANMSGAVGHKRVTKEYFYNYNVPTPPLELQQLIINKFDEVWKNTTKIISSKHKKIEELTKLKSAILAQELQSEAA